MSKGNRRPRKANDVKVDPPQRKSVVTGGEGTKPAGDAAAPRTPPPAEDIEARRAEVARKQRELEESEKAAAAPAAGDEKLESDNPADTGDAKPVGGKKKGGKKGGQEKPKLTDEEKAARRAEKEAAKQAAAEAERKRQQKETRARAENAARGEFEASPDAPRTEVDSGGQQEARPKNSGGTEKKWYENTEQLNIIPRLVSGGFRNAKTGFQQLWRLRNDAAILGGGGYAYGKAGGISGVSNFLMNGFGGDDDRQNKPAASPAAPAVPAPTAPAPDKPMSLRDRLHEKRDIERSKMPPSRSESLLQALRYRRMS